MAKKGKKSKAYKQVKKTTISKNGKKKQIIKTYQCFSGDQLKANVEQTLHEEEDSDLHVKKETLEPNLNLFSLKKVKRVVSWISRFWDSF